MSRSLVTDPGMSVARSELTFPDARVRSLPARAVFALALHLMALSAIMPTRADSQQIDSARVRPKPDSVRARAPRAPALLTRMNPPITPKRAFLYSLALPGFGQSRLDRGVSGALFSGVELSAIAMVRRATVDLREARRYLGDSLPVTFAVNGTTATPVSFGPNGFTEDLVRTRRLHVEDWMAVLAFNHLLAGADAFVSAQLWDVPIKMAAVPRPDGGALLIATIRW